MSLPWCCPEEDKAFKHEDLLKNPLKKAWWQPLNCNSKQLTTITTRTIQLHETCNYCMFLHFVLLEEWGIWLHCQTIAPLSWPVFIPPHPDLFLRSSHPPSQTLRKTMANPHESKSLKTNCDYPWLPCTRPIRAKVWVFFGMAWSPPCHFHYLFLFNASTHLGIHRLPPGWVHNGTLPNFHPQQWQHPPAAQHHLLGIFVYLPGGTSKYMFIVWIIYH